jgi:hypothetical protein
MKKGIIVLVLVVVILISAVYSQQGLVELGIEPASHVFIYSPLNITYYRDQGDYNISINVGSERNLFDWRYTLIDLRNSNITQNMISFEPNISINALRWENQLIVYANDSGGNRYNNSVIFYIFVNNSSPIIKNLPDEFYICEGNSFSYIFNVSNFDEDYLEENLNPLNPFYIDYSDNYNLSYVQYEIYSGVLLKNQTGLYNEEISFSDGYLSDNKYVNITVIEINNAPVIQNISVQNIFVYSYQNTSYYYKVNVSDIEDGNQDSNNLSFDISFTGNQLFNISSNGEMNFSADYSQIGFYNVSVCVTDLGLVDIPENISYCSQNGGPITSCKNFSLVITNISGNPEIYDYRPSILNIDSNNSQIMAFNVSSRDYVGSITDILWYVDDVLIELSTSSSVDEFSYIFGCGTSGEHNIKAVVTNGYLNDSVEWNISVNSLDCILNVIGGGGGSGNYQCKQKLGCNEWSSCSKINGLNSSKEVNDYLIERCRLLNIQDCGYQTRLCEDVNYCNKPILILDLIRECQYSINPSCKDKIKNCHSNSCEVLVDCGGPCEACPTCSDGIKNQEESDIDCGGSCQKCKEKDSFEIPVVSDIKEIYEKSSTGEKVSIVIVGVISGFGLFYLGRWIFNIFLESKTVVLRVKS